MVTDPWPDYLERNRRARVIYRACPRLPGMRGRYVSGPELARMERAEEVCWTLMLAMGLDVLHVANRAERDFLAEPLQAWCDQAVATGQMRQY